jgi:ectoine hydroxylase-related dioxygenase (phytanoyl-CoA dioxygenase family)
MASIDYFDYDAADDEKRVAYLDKGAIVVRNVVPQPVIQDFRAHLIALIRSRLRGLGVTVDTDLDWDDLYTRLCAVDTRFGHELIVVARDLVAFYRLMSEPRITQVAQVLVGSSLCQVVHDVCLFRIDPPGAGQDRLLDWHQDYPYNVLSTSAVTVWVPLTDVSSEMGPLRVIPRSHDRIRPVDFRERYVGGGNGTGHKVFGLRPSEGEVTGEPETSVADVRAGDAIFLHACLLHASGVNHSRRCRWVFNVRYGDALHESVVGRGWRVVRDRDPYCFRDLHPSLTRVVSD